MAVEEVEIVQDGPDQSIGDVSARFFPSVDHSVEPFSETAWDASDSLKNSNGNAGDSLSDVDKLLAEERSAGDGRDLIRLTSMSPSVSSWEEVPSQQEVAISETYDADAVLDSAWKNIPDPGLKQFWENDFWENLFNPSISAVDSMTRGLKRPFQPQPVDESLDHEELVEHRIAKKISVATGPSYLHCVADSVELSWKEEREAKWEVAVRRWVSLIDSWTGDAHICQLLRGQSDFRGKAQILVDIFFNKAPQTLLKRVNSLGRLANLLTSMGKSFPCSEQEFYDMLKYESDRAAPVSRLKGYYEAITFVRFVLNVEELQCILDSRRCLGAASSTVLSTPNQSDPFTVKQLLQIHRELETSQDVWVRNMCGALLFCTYARSRWSDAQHAERLECDYDFQHQMKYIEIKTSMHKTCRALHMRHVFLPITAPSTGVSTTPWGPIWIAAREELRITDLKVFPLMPAPSKTLEPTKRPLSTTEVKKWLHLILDGIDVKEDSKLTSHSCKSTCLSYMAKRGASFEDRLCLGYHSNSSKSMALVYSRDGASRPLALLEHMLWEVRCGIFEPDNSRSGRLLSGTPSLYTSVSAGIDIQSTLDPPSSKRMEAVKKELPEMDSSEQDILVQSSDDEAYITTSSSDSSGDERCVVAPVVGHFQVPVSDDFHVWKNKHARMFHLSFRDYKQSLVCGRKVTSNFERHEGPIRFDSCKCKQCFRQLKG